MLSMPSKKHAARNFLTSDIATNYAACDKAREELGWVAEYDLARMCEDSWRWQSNNPNGYNE